ncbi:MAG: cation diffusion facilitator family transporter [Pseudonocardiaceae bacterium]|nr:cation diffusion facilitator family transporter [Pseudonocardiaceae bacterium]
MSRGSHGGAFEPNGDGHTPGTSPGSDRFWLGAALVLLLGFMAVEVVVGLLAGSLALLSDAAHMLTDAGAIALALVAIRLAARPARGGYTFGLKRAEILSAQANGITLLLLTVYFGYEGVRRLVDPPPVEGLPVLVTALAGIVVNLAATWMLARADRRRLNVEGAFQHILTDLFAFIATAVAGLVMVLTGFARADALAALVVAALMAKAGYGLALESGRIFLEAAPRGIDPQRVEADICSVTGVVGVHELDVWEVTSGFTALSAHVLVSTAHDCHERRVAVERSLSDRFGIHHTTLQVDHRDEPDGRTGSCAGANASCGDLPVTDSISPPR